MTNILQHCDAQALLCAHKDSIDLCYIDPPFNVGIDFRYGKHVAYSDKWGGIDGFLSFLGPIIEAARNALVPSGLFWLHLDYRAIHEAKVLSDKIFGRTAFRGEIVWSPGNGARRKHGPSMTHQTLLVYSRDPCPNATFVWNCNDSRLREQFAATSLRMHFRSTDSSGRLYRDRSINGKTYRYYADEGRRLGSVWTDIPAMLANTPIRAEGTGYPNQKPEKLLERVISLSSIIGSIVCDPMCGSGTALLVAARLGRSFIGGDSSQIAIDVTKKRLIGASIPFKLGET